MRNLIKPLAKSVLIPLGLTAAAAAADSGKQKKDFRIWSSFVFCFVNNDTINIK